MGFHIYDEDDDSFHDLVLTSVSHEDHEDALIEFEETDKVGQLRVMFNLDRVRVHQGPDGDVTVTLK